MEKITLEKVLGASLVEVRDYSSVGIIKPFEEYNRRIRTLGEAGRLSFEEVRSVMDEGLIDHSSIIDLTVNTDLVYSGGLFLPGASAVIANDKGSVVGVYDNLNDDPTLKSYGPGLMWALLKVGQEAFASGIGSFGNTQPGYNWVRRGLEDVDEQGELLDTPYEKRHHIGGASVRTSERLDLPGRGRDRLAKATLYCGVSGVLATEQFREGCRADYRLKDIEIEARNSGALGGFEGNLYAGSLDSTLANRILAKVVGADEHQEEPFSQQAKIDILSRSVAGINVH